MTEVTWKIGFDGDVVWIGVVDGTHIAEIHDTGRTRNRYEVDMLYGPVSHREPARTAREAKQYAEDAWAQHQRQLARASAVVSTAGKMNGDIAAVMLWLHTRGFHEEKRNDELGTVWMARNNVRVVFEDVQSTIIEIYVFDPVKPGTDGFLIWEAKFNNAPQSLVMTTLNHATGLR